MISIKSYLLIISGVEAINFFLYCLKKQLWEMSIIERNKLINKERKRKRKKKKRNQKILNVPINRNLCILMY